MIWWTELAGQGALKPVRRVCEESGQFLIWILAQISPGAIGRHPVAL